MYIYYNNSNNNNSNNNIDILWHFHSLCASRHHLIGFCAMDHSPGGCWSRGIYGIHGWMCWPGDARGVKCEDRNDVVFQLWQKKLVVGKKLENFELMLICSSGSSILGMPTRILFSSTTKQKMSFRNILLVMRCWQRQRDNSSFQAWQVDFRLRKHQQF